MKKFPTRRTPFHKILTRRVKKKEIGVTIF